MGFKTKQLPKMQGSFVMKPKTVETKSGEIVSWRGSFEFGGNSYAVSITTETNGQLRVQDDRKNEGKSVSFMNVAVFPASAKKY